MITNQNLTFQYYLSFLAFISKKKTAQISSLRQSEFPIHVVMQEFRYYVNQALAQHQKAL